MIVYLLVVSALLGVGNCRYACPDGLFYDNLIKTCRQSDDLPPTVPSCPAEQETVLYFPHEKYCSKFYSCYHGHIVENSCPPKTEFNEVLGVCDWISATGCSSKTTTGNPMTTTQFQTTDKPVLTTVANLTTTDEPILSTISNSTTEGPNMTTSGNFTTTEASNMTTVGNTTDFPETTTSVVGPTPTPIICPQNSSVISVIPDPDSCQKFYICFNGVASVYECDDDQEFDPTLARCVPISSTGCTASKPTTTEPASTTTSNNATETTTQLATTGPPTPGPCKPNDNAVTIVAHETDCNKFYVCFMGMGTEFDCGFGNNMEFDPATSKCVPISSTGCTASQQNTTTTPQATTELPTTTEKPTMAPNTTTQLQTTAVSEMTTSIVLPTSAPNICPNTSSISVIPHEYDCQKFYICFGGMSVEYSCDENFEFNPQTLVCVPISSNGCTANQTTTTETPKGPCKPGDNSITSVPHETDCHKFYICFMGIPTEYSCDQTNDLEFDPILQMCVPASESGCNSKPGPKKSWIFGFLPW